MKLMSGQQLPKDDIASPFFSVTDVSKNSGICISITFSCLFHGNFYQNSLCYLEVPPESPGNPHFAGDKAEEGFTCVLMFSISETNLRCDKM